MELWPKNPFISHKIQSFQWNSQRSIYRRFRNSGKQIYLLMNANTMYLDQMDIIMRGENQGKNFGKTIFFYRSDMVVVASRCGDAWKHKEWKILIYSEASWTDTFMWTFFENIWKPVLKNVGFKNILPRQLPKTFCIFGKGVVLVQLPKSN